MTLSDNVDVDPSPLSHSLIMTLSDNVDADHSPLSHSLILTLLSTSQQDPITYEYV